MLNKKGSVLIFVYAVIFILLSLSASVIAHSILEKKAFEITKQHAEAFYVAEAGMDSVLAVLKTSSSYSGTGASPVSVSRASTVIGQYETAVVDIGSSMRRITVTSYVPQKTVGSGVLRQKCNAEGIARVSANPPPQSFYDYAIYSAGEVQFNGSNNAVTGGIVYSSSISGTPTGTYTTQHDVTISPLQTFDFQKLRDKANSQGNLYTAARLAANDPFPTTFLNADGGPNVVYVEGDMKISGNVTAGGFFVVVGNVLTDPTVTSDTSITGKVTINGCIYTTGELEVKGGGGPDVMNITGGVWAGDEAKFRGNAAITYDSGEMNAVKALVDSLQTSTVQFLSWRQLELYS